MTSPKTLAGVAADRIRTFATREAARYRLTRPKSAASLAEGAAKFLNGVPMHWMTDWPMPHFDGGCTGAGCADHRHRWL